MIGLKKLMPFAETLSLSLVKIVLKRKTKSAFSISIVKIESLENANVVIFFFFQSYRVNFAKTNENR